MNENGSPVISRLHCEIFFIEGQVLITDRNSKNGTFIGENKAPCIGLKRSLQNEDILFLGQERFLVLFSYEAREPNPGESNGNKLYRCNDITCGAETSDYNEKCPSCNAMRTLQVVV
jgi:pSer/pThr/pTyr-binding forkhead associated (FHA) protein